MEDIEPTIQHTDPNASISRQPVITERTSLLYRDTTMNEHQQKLVEEAVKAAEEISSHGREGSIGNDSID